jgi:hypothetical protein
VTTGRVVVVVGGGLVVVVGAKVGGVVTGEVSLPDGDRDDGVEVVGVAGDGKAVVDGTEVVGVDGIVPLVLAPELDPGCSLATTTPITAVAPVAASATARVSRRSLTCARSLVSGEW